MQEPSAQRDKQDVYLSLHPSDLTCWSQYA